MDFLIRWRIFCLLINKTSAKVTPPILCEILYRVFQKLNRATYLVLSINLSGIAFFYCMEINSWIKHTVISNLAQVMIMMFKTRQYFYKYLAFFFLSEVLYVLTFSSRCVTHPEALSQSRSWHTFHYTK